MAGPTVARDKALNTELANAAVEAVFALRFEGASIPNDVWTAATDLLNAIAAWRVSDDKRAPVAS